MSVILDRQAIIALGDQFLKDIGYATDTFTNMVREEERRLDSLRAQKKAEPVIIDGETLVIGAVYTVTPTPPDTGRYYDKRSRHHAVFMGRNPDRPDRLVFTCLSERLAFGQPKVWGPARRAHARVEYVAGWIKVVREHKPQELIEAAAKYASQHASS